MTTIGQLRELILYVEDMAAQVSFYRDVLGFCVIEPADADDLTDAYWVMFETGQCKLALHGGGKRQFGDDAPKFVFTVEDIEAGSNLLRQAGVHVGEIRSPAPGISVVDAKDPEGNTFSLEARDGDIHE